MTYCKYWPISSPAAGKKIWCFVLPVSLFHHKPIGVGRFQPRLPAGFFDLVHCWLVSLSHCTKYKVYIGFTYSFLSSGKGAKHDCHVLKDAEFVLHQHTYSSTFMVHTHQYTYPNWWLWEQFRVQSLAKGHFRYCMWTVVDRSTNRPTAAPPTSTHNDWCQEWRTFLPFL